MKIEKKGGDPWKHLYIVYFHYFNHNLTCLGNELKDNTLSLLSIAKDFRNLFSCARYHRARKLRDEREYFMIFIVIQKQLVGMQRATLGQKCTCMGF